MKTCPQLTLHCPAYNCWNTLNLAVNGLKHINIKIYDSPENLNININKNQEYQNCVLLIDYFGISDLKPYLDILNKDTIVIVDLAHAFPTDDYILNVTQKSDYAFISLRKFLPTPDGAILFTKCNDLKNSKTNQSPSAYWKILITLSKNKILDNWADSAGIRYRLFKAHENSLNTNTYTQVSFDTFNNANLKELLNKRTKNYKFLYKNEKFKAQFQLLPFNIREDNICPLYFPYCSKNVETIQKHLAKNKVYCPIFWPKLDTNLKILGLPIDDRYKKSDMKKIIHIIKNIEE